MKADLCELDHRYRAKRTGQSRADYASAIQGFRRPRRHVGAYVFAAALLLLTLLMARAA